MKYITAILAAAFALTGCVATAPTKKTTAQIPPEALSSAFGHPVPVGAPSQDQKIVSGKWVEGNESLVDSTWRIGKFRPNLNMPELLDGELVAGSLSAQKAADLERIVNNGEAIIWTIPRLKLIPCDEGCVGNKDYEKAAAKFLSLYNDMASTSTVAYRGEMRVKVRWYREKNFIEKVNPLSQAQSVFGIEFPIEGVALTLGSTCSGKDQKIDDCVERAATKFKMGVIFPLSVGVRNHFTVSLDPQYDPNLYQSANSFVAAPTRAIMSFLGKTDYSSRIEPIGPQHKNLLPAIDGLTAGEGIALDAPKLFDWF